MNFPFHTHLLRRNRFRTLGLGVALVLTMLIGNGALMPRVMDAAPLVQVPDYAVQAQAIAQAFRDLGLTPQVDNVGSFPGADSYYSVKAGRTLSNPTRTESHIAYISKDPNLIPNQVNARGTRTLSLGRDPASIAGSSSTPDQVSGGQRIFFTTNDATVRLGCSNVFAMLAFHSEAQLTNKDETMARAETARQQTQLEQNAENTARQFYQALQTRGACQAGGPAGRLNVGIGGKYDETKDFVDVTAGVENRPGVGIGDDYYEWSLDGKVVKQGKELKTIQLDTANLSAGKHEIVVKVTDNINKISGGATYTFEKKKAGPQAQPPAAKPPAGASGILTVETSSGSKTLKPGDNAQLEIRRGDRVSMKVVCENLVALMGLFFLVTEGWKPDSYQFEANAFALALTIQKLNCVGLLTQPKQVAMAVSPAIPSLPILAMPDAAVQLKVELVQGPLGVEITNDKVAMEIATATSIVTSVGRNDFDVLYAPKTGDTIVVARQGSVSVQLQDSRLSPVTLRAGQVVTVTQTSISPVAAIPTSDDPLAGMAVLAVCGGASCLGAIALFAGVLTFSRSRSRPARSVTPLPPVAPRPTALPKRGAPPQSGKPTDLPK